MQMFQDNKDKKECVICGKKTKNWIRCYKLYFCSMEHLNKYETTKK